MAIVDIRGMYCWEDPAGSPLRGMHRHACMHRVQYPIRSTMLHLRPLDWNAPGAIPDTHVMITISMGRHTDDHPRIPVVRVMAMGLIDSIHPLQVLVHTMSCGTHWDELPPPSPPTSHTGEDRMHPAIPAHAIDTFR